MARPLAILMVEDSDDDAALMLHALRVGGLQATSERVDSAPSLRAAWAGAAWDVVLCDYGLPGFSLEEALAITREHNGTVPFIAVSGSIGEEAVAALMRAGASDVVLKSSLASRLASVVKRELAAERNSAQLHASEAQLLENAAKLARISASVPGLIYAIQRAENGSFRMPFATSRIEEVFGLKAEEVAENCEPLLSRIRAGDRDRVLESAAKSARDLSPWHSEWQYSHPTKGLCWIEATSLPRGEPDGSVVWYGFAADVTDRKRDASALRDASAVVANTDRGVFTTSLDGIITSINVAFSASTGHSEAEALGHHIRLLQSSRHDPELYEMQMRSLEETGSWQSEIWLKRKNDELFPAFLTMNVVRDESGHPVNYVGTFTDISRAKEQDHKLEQLASCDALTGLPNRAVFLTRLGHALDRAKRLGKTGAVLFLDLDRFQSVNESLGHQSGDEVLRVSGCRLQTWLRDGGIVARLGGDEFAILLEDLADAGAAAQIADLLIEKIPEPIRLSGGQDVVIGASIGISLFPADSVEVDELMRDADAALHQAKADGCGIYRFWTPELTRGAADRFNLEGRLRRAIERHEFVLHYQPLVSLADRSLMGVEALVRWEDPERGLIPPNQFIALAERTGLIGPLGEWVLETACAQMQAWRESGLFDGSVAVNLSPIQFRQPDIVDRVKRVLEKTGLPGAALELEITEGALIGDTAEAQATLARLKALGVGLAIDDFGTGYSSLAYLKRFPIDKLKIDQSFVRDIPNDPADMEITAVVISLARALHLTSLAEGIETEAQLEFLRSRGCDLGQGYLFARPMPADDLTVFATRAAAAGFDIGESLIALPTPIFREIGEAQMLLVAPNQ